MPRYPASETLTLNVSALRAYVSGASKSEGTEILGDALTHGNTGARELIRLVTGMRSDARGRRDLATVQAEFTRPRSQQARWLGQLAASVMATWRVLRQQSIPLTAGGTAPATLRHLPRRARQVLRPTGVVGRPLEDMAERARVAAEALWEGLDGRQCVLWMDNWCMLRWGTDPVHPEYTQNVTALAILDLDALLDRPMPTRSTTVPTFPGHPDLGYVVRHVEGAVALCTSVAASMHTTANAFNREELQRTDVRVPLDLVRHNMRSLQWRPFSLTEQTVSGTVDLLDLLRSARDIQVRTRRVLPLLVDENIHYRVLRMLYSPAFAEYDVHAYLKDVPLIYGIWHAYKHTLLVVYKCHLPVLAHLEENRAPQAGGSARSHRKVLYLEKLFAALLLCRGAVIGHLEARLRHLQRRPEGIRNCEYIDYAEEILYGLDDLLSFYVPTLLHIGYKVRECSWNGRPGGGVLGDTARRVLEMCLLVQVHLLQDRQARTEYVRTISVALLAWQPWMSRLPGCVFVEEAGEALISRLAGACRRSPTVITFEQTLQLFLTLPLPSAEPHSSRGHVREELVREMGRRVRALIGAPGGRLFPKARDATTYTWRPGEECTWSAAGPVPRHPDHGTHITVFRSALQTLVGRRPLTAEVKTWVDTTVPPCPDALLVRREMAMKDIAGWRGVGQRTWSYSQLRIPSVVSADGASSSTAAAPAPNTGALIDNAAGTAPADAESLYGYPESLYEPPGSDLSEGYVSPAATDGLGSLGELDESPSVACSEDEDTDLVLTPCLPRAWKPHFRSHSLFSTSFGHAHLRNRFRG